MIGRAVALASLFGLLLASSSAFGADLLVVSTEKPFAFFGFYGAKDFVDQPEGLWDNTVSWAVGGANPAVTDVLLYTWDGTVADCAPGNWNAIAFYNLLSTAGYNVQVDHRNNFATRTGYSGFELVVFPNFGYSDALAPRADNVIASGLPFITLEPGQTDELGIGTGVTVFSGVVQFGVVVDNGHAITNQFGLGEVIPMAQKGAEAFPFDIPTDGITTSGSGRVLIGMIPEPGTVLLIGSGVVFALQRWRPRRIGAPSRS